MILVEVTVEYILTIDTLGTLMSSVHEIILKTVRIKEAFSFESTVIFLGKALSAKGIEIA